MLSILWSASCARAMTNFLSPRPSGVTYLFSDYRHHPSDVVGGAVLGIIVAYTAWRFYYEILKKTYKSYGENHLMQGSKVGGVIRDPFDLEAPAMYLSVSSSESPPGEREFNSQLN